LEASPATIVITDLALPFGRLGTRSPLKKGSITTPSEAMGAALAAALKAVRGYQLRQAGEA